MRPEEVSSEDQVWGQKNDSAKGEATRERVTVRLLESKDSVQELTDLLHRAFKQDGQNPYAYSFATQSEETTHMQVKSGDCWVAELDGHLIGIGLVLPSRPDGRRRWYRPRLIAYLRLLAVHPDFQGIGIGTMLFDNCEQSARKMGAWELAGSSPVGSRQLSFYKRRGYNVFKYVKFSDTSYHSVAFSKWISERQKESMIRKVVRETRYYKSLFAYKLGLLR
jgi:GNAT superfamily N-acetyltransferase